MDFRKKLKMRLYFAIFYIVLGLVAVLAGNIVKNDFLPSYGLAIAVCGIVQIRNYVLITRNEETIKKREIAEKDERNIAISDKAKSFSFIAYILLASVAVIVLHIMGKQYLATVIAETVCALLVFYWIAYIIIRKKS